MKSVVKTVNNVFISLTIICAILGAGSIYATRYIFPPEPYWLSVRWWIQLMFFCLIVFPLLSRMYNEIRILLVTAAAISFMRIMEYSIEYLSIGGSILWAFVVEVIVFSLLLLFYSNNAVKKEFHYKGSTLPFFRNISDDPMKKIVIFLMALISFALVVHAASPALFPSTFKQAHWGLTVYAVVLIYSLFYMIKHRQWARWTFVSALSLFLYNGIFNFIFIPRYRQLHYVFLGGLLVITIYFFASKAVNGYFDRE